MGVDRCCGKILLDGAIGARLGEMKRLARISAVLIAGVLASRAVADEPPAAVAKTHTVLVGGRPIQLPEPAGYVRSDGRDPQKDQLMGAAVGPSNRYLARFDPPEGDPSTESAKKQRELSAQVVISTENMEIGEKTFATSRDEMKAGIEKMKSSIGEKLEEISRRTGKAISKESGVETALDLSGVAIFGFFEDTPNSLGFSMAMNVKVTADGKNSIEKKVTSAMMVPVNGRLILLYSLSNFASEEDRKWAESAVATWRDAVVAANPRVQGPDRMGSMFNGVSRSALIGGCVGVLVGLVGVIIKKLKAAKSSV
jgi:hypothetical protein